ncbi:MAG: hypothetical protein LBO08_02765 [Rickettsiales bacterium]|jgi:type IV secretory pathway VirB10-like protein|nr:hypothetical protein [Rickettsiales bacterium]
MAGLKQSLTELKKTTPKHVQWLFMGVAFIIVLVLLFLLLSGKSDKKNGSGAGGSAAVLAADPDQIDWTENEIGAARTAKITLNPSGGDIRVISAKLSAAVMGVKLQSAGCTNLARITEKIPCSLGLSWDGREMGETGLEINIAYVPFGMSEEMAENLVVAIALGSAAKPVEIEKPAEPPVAKPVYEMTDAEKEALINDTPSLHRPEHEPIAPPVVVSRPELTPEKRSNPCYEFAFVGYDLNGNQMGWIRPSGGTYKFHPFSDRDCSKPSGEYNAETGFIIANGKKIGSDAEHISFSAMATGNLPKLSNAAPEKTVIRARQLIMAPDAKSGSKQVFTPTAAPTNLVPSSANDAFVSSEPYDRKFVLRQYKPIPATIVNEIRAETKNVGSQLPVQATVDRHVYSDNGRTIIVPAGTLMLGYLTGDLPGPYKSIGRMHINWYRFVRPDGVEFNFNGEDGSVPFAGDSQGRVGVPGYGSSDYLENMLMPMVTAIVPAMVNMIAPISDKFVNQIDLDNNTVTQSGQMRSSELAKQEIISAWNKVANRMAIDMLDNTVPPFSIAAGTRITVYSPKDLIVNFCGKGDAACASVIQSSPYVAHIANKATAANQTPEERLGQVRSLAVDLNGNIDPSQINDERLKEFYRQMNQYQGKAVAANQAYATQQATNGGVQNKKTGEVLVKGTKEYNEQVLGIKYNDKGVMQDPSGSFQQEAPPPAAPVSSAPAQILCPDDGTVPDMNGCCTGETYTDMGDAGFNCCPAGGGDCFPPIL